MPLNGSARRCIKRFGGITAIKLIEADRIVSVARNAATGSFSDITLAEGAAFVSFAFAEGSASLTETVCIEDGMTGVGHTLTFRMDSLDELTSKAARSLLDASACGLAAVVETAAGDSFLVGRSVEFGGERPLRPSVMIAATGSGSDNTAAVAVTLASLDTSFSMPFTGTV